MARLLVMREASPGRYEAGDVVAVLPDGARFGICEDLEEWTGAGHPPEQFPATFYVVDLEGLSTEDAKTFLEGDGARRRSWSLNAAGLERRLDPMRQTLFNSYRIRRRWTEVAALMQQKA